MDKMLFKTSQTLNKLFPGKHQRSADWSSKLYRGHSWWTLACPHGKQWSQYSGLVLPELALLTAPLDGCEGCWGIRRARVEGHWAGTQNEHMSLAVFPYHPSMSMVPSQWRWYLIHSQGTFPGWLMSYETALLGQRFLETRQGQKTLQRALEHKVLWHLILAQSTLFCEFWSPEL